MKSKDTKTGWEESIKKDELQSKMEINIQNTVLQILR